MSSEKVARSNKRHFVVGLKQTLKALKEDQVTSLIVVKDVEVYLLAQVFSQINYKGAPATYFEGESALGKAAGINVNVTVIALLSEDQ